MQATMHGAIETFSAALGAGVIASVLCAAIALLMARTVARTRATLRHLCWHSALMMSVVATLIPLAGSRVVIHVPATWLPWTAARYAVLVEAGPPTTRVSRALDHAQPRREHDPSRAPFDYRAVGVFIWLVGASVVAVRSGRQVLAARSIRRRAVPMDESWRTETFRDVLRLSGYRRSVALLRSADVDIPCVAGSFTPAVLVPLSSTEWSAQTWRSVSAHEMAHVVRADLRTLILASVACTMQWFNPVVWWLAAKRTREAEIATDALALTFGIRPSSYADALLSLAEFSMPRRYHVMAFAQRSALVDRVHAILAAQPNAGTISQRAQSGVLAICGVMAISVSSVRMVPLTSRVVRAASATPLTAPVIAAEPRATSGRAQVNSPLARQSRRASKIVRQVAAARPASAADFEIASRDWVDDALLALSRSLDDPSPQVRMAAARSLAQLAATAARTSRARSATDPDPLGRGAKRSDLAPVPVQRQ